MAQSSINNVNVSIQSLRDENKPLSLKIMSNVYEVGVEAYLELSIKDKNLINSLYKQLVNQLIVINHADEYYLQFENESLIGEFIKQTINSNVHTLQEAENKNQCCLALGYLINNLLSEKVNLIKQTEEAHRKVQEQEIKQQEHNENIKDLIPPEIQIAFSGIDDDMAILSIHLLKLYIKCVDVLHSVIYF
jgi:hypothetical protein